MPIATLIASERLASGQLSNARDYLAESAIKIEQEKWIETGRVLDLIFDGDISKAQNALLPLTEEIDLVVQATENREKKLLISDMDSTMITVECIDELADYAGIKEQIAKVTERAMQGEMDFEEALRARVALLKGLHRQNIETCLHERVSLTSGAKTLVRTMASRGAHCVLVSGGFNQFAKSVAKELGFHEYYANELKIIDDILTGAIDGDIVDAQRKKIIHNHIIANNSWMNDNSIAVGDGANDIPMIKSAGLGVAFHAKVAAEKEADMMVRHNDLTALLSAQAISNVDWV